jgi:hypothetical protein
MSNAWLKLIGTAERPCPEAWKQSHASSRRRPSGIHAGDHMVLYAVGRAKRVFALAGVTSEPYDSGDKEWPYRIDITYLVHLPTSQGVHIDQVSTAKRNLIRSLRQASYIRLFPEEYERAASKLRKASES